LVFQVKGFLTKKLKNIVLCGKKEASFLPTNIQKI